MFEQRRQDRLFRRRAVRMIEEQLLRGYWSDGRRVELETAIRNRKSPHEIAIEMLFSRALSIVLPFPARALLGRNGSSEYSMPQAALFSTPRLSRSVQSTPSATSQPIKRSIASSLDAISSLPVGCSRIKLTFAGMLRSRCRRFAASSRRSLKPAIMMYSNVTGCRVTWASRRSDLVNTSSE